MRTSALVSRANDRLHGVDVSGNFHNLIGAKNIVTEYPWGLDYRRVVAMYWDLTLQVGDRVRWNPTWLEKDGTPAIRHYLVLARQPHPGRKHEGVWQAVLVAPVPDITVAGVTHHGPDDLPPVPEILDKLRVFDRPREGSRS